MITLHLAFKDKSKKITMSSNMASRQIASLIANTFRIRERIVGLTNSKGSFISLENLIQNLNSFKKELLYIVAAEDVNVNGDDQNQQNMMSFASDKVEPIVQKRSKRESNSKKDFQTDRNDWGFSKVQNSNQLQYFEEQEKTQASDIPEKIESFYQGLIGNIEAFEELFLEETEATIVFCFIKEKPKGVRYPYYLFHTDKNSCIVYVGKSRICEFFIESMSSIPVEIEKFIRSIVKAGDYREDEVARDGARKNQGVVPQRTNRHTQEQAQQKAFIKNEGDIQFNDFAMAMNLMKKADAEDEEQQEDENEDNNQDDDRDRGDHSICDDLRENEIRKSLLENLMKLRQGEEITELEFFKMKSELLENQEDFVRKYQMGSRKGHRGQRKVEAQGEHWAFNQSDKKATNSRPIYSMGSGQNETEQTRSAKNHRNRQKEQNREKSHKKAIEEERLIESKYDRVSAQPLNSREQRRVTKYEIPIIVRKYNNVVEKISTSYPLSQEQEHAINLILELELKGLISEKESGVYKSSILQEEPDVFPLFMDYFNGKIDQIQLVSSLKRKKKINSEKKQRAEHNMRLLMKFCRQSNYELLRGLLLENNYYLINSLEKYRSHRNSELLEDQLSKIADFYRRKQVLESILD